MVLEPYKLFMPGSKFGLESLKLKLWHLFDFNFQEVGQLADLVILEQYKCLNFLRFCGIVLKLKTPLISRIGSVGFSEL